MRKKNLPRTALSRMGSLIGAGTKVGLREAQHRLFDRLGNDNLLAVRLRQVNTLVDTLSQLKGAAMKLGQVLSLEFSDLLPREILEVFEKLYDDSSTMQFDEVETLLKKAFGKDRFSQVESLSKEPIASASIGQVHTAIIEGRKVAIKVQFPFVAKSIDADVKVVKKFIDAYLKIAGKHIELSGVFQEVTRILMQETDYLKEADNMLLYAKHFESDPRFKIPRPLLDWTTKQVLVMTFEEGERLSAWVRGTEAEASRSPERVSQFSSMMLDLVLREFFEVGMVQTDPNLGNFLILPDSMQLVLLDFGAVNTYSHAFRVRIRRLIELAIAGDPEKLLQFAYRHRFLDPAEEPATKELFLQMLFRVGELFSEENQPFDFSDGDYIAATRATVLEFIQAVRHSKPVKELIFVNRKLGGVFHILKDLKAKQDLHVLWKKVQQVTRSAKE